MLAERLALLARAIRDRIETVLAVETDAGPVTRLMKAFQEALIHDLPADGFADMYAQTIAYGLLSARIANPGGDSTAASLPVTNPFLKELMETFLHVGVGARSREGIDFDELGVGEVVQLLDDANIEAVVRDFGDRNPEEDPVIHFYELFLKEYDAKKRMQRGVFYTPRPVVSYIVRSVDELLRTEFGLKDGLADTATWLEMAQRNPNIEIPKSVPVDAAFVQILDPATGTGTFLVEVIDVIHQTLAEKWRTDGADDMERERRWNEYVPRHLLPRLHGYELLMAPYAIAHLKVGLKLHETGYRFESSERARVFLTNALEPAHDGSGQLELEIPALAHEARAVNEIKEHHRFTVVIGNPPYANYGRQNRIPFILTLLQTYKKDLNERKINLDDDFIKFIRFGQWLVERSMGVCSFITNNSYLDGVTHRVMRKSLLDTFSQVEIVNLHGSATLGERRPDGGPDENVFDIRQGVAISRFIRAQGGGTTNVRYHDLWGARREKYDALLSSHLPEGMTVLAEQPYWFFAPHDFSLRVEYEALASLRGLFSANNTGIQTKRDGLAVQFTRDEMRAVLMDVIRLSEEELRQQYGLPPDGRDWRVDWAKADIGQEIDEKQIVPILYRPFDLRWTYFTGRTKGFLAYPRRETMRHLLRPNRAIVTLRINGSGDDFVAFVADTLVEKGSLPRGNYSVFPMYLYQDNGPQVSLGEHGAFAVDVGRLLPPSMSAERSATVDGHTAFNYVYAILFSRSYRERYADFLKIEFPRLPRAGSADLYKALASLGGELVDLHLLRDVQPSPRINYVGPKEPSVVRVSWRDDAVFLEQPTGRESRLDTLARFEGVASETWFMRFGGYQVCEKWLKDRRGRTLSDTDIAHYQKIVVALSETRRVMDEIDDVIEEHGGWPGAFTASASQGTRTANDGNPLNKSSQ